MILTTLKNDNIIASVLQLLTKLFQALKELWQTQALYSLKDCSGWHCQHEVISSDSMSLEEWEVLWREKCYVIPVFRRSLSSQPCNLEIPELTLNLKLWGKNIKNLRNKNVSCSRWSSSEDYGTKTSSNEIKQDLLGWSHISISGKI